jgi:hypothetical protein
MHLLLRRRDFLEGLALLLSASRLHAQSHSPGGNANHIHTILRVPVNDFGEDWLRRHHQQHPHA